MDEKNSSYSIYVDRRPHRTLFIFNEKKLTFDHIDKIIEYFIRKWGGRYNFILPTKSNKLSDGQWQFTKRFDPDFVKLCIPVSKKIALDLNTRLTPLEVTDALVRDGFSPRIDHEGISILPTPNNIRQAGNSFESFLVIFNIDECQDEVIKKFILRNFGTVDLMEMSNQVLSSFENKKIFKITTKQSLIDALSSFNDFKTYVFPIQLCSLGDYIDDDRSRDNENNFYIFVGDSPLELMDYWNNPFYLQSWTRTKYRQLWLSTELAEDNELTEALKNFIHGRADPYGNGQKEALFISRTLAQDRLSGIADRLTNGTWVGKRTSIKTAETYPQYSDYFSFDRIKTDMVHIRASGQEEKIIIESPNIEEGVMGGEYWMNDLYIQVPEKKVVPVNFETWLQLPRNNSVVHTTVKGPSRITKDGVPCVLTFRQSQFHPDSQHIDITLPKTHDIFASMILTTGNPYFTDDIRNKFIQPYKYEIGISSAGRHLHGFLDVMGSLEGAYQILEERHWRKFFDLLANVSDSKESKRLDDIKQRLIKRIKPMADPSNLTSGRFVDWLAHDLQKTAKIYVEANPRALPFSELEKIAHDELKEYNASNPNNKFKYSKKQILEALSRLTDSGVLLIGYEFTCPSCLNREWRALNEANQFIECRGCGYQYAFAPETEIRYKLTTLVENGIRMKGVAPVALGLGTIFRDARHYFDFLPPVNIYKKKQLLTDLDICCIIDGNFIIGEVKAQQGLFHKSDFQKTADLAKEIHPNKIVFCSLDKTPLQWIKDEISKINTELKPYDITAEWLSFDSYLFEASPIY